MFKKQTLLLFIIILTAVVLRFLALGQVPISLDWDEAALGYNGYSLLHTGRDEYGKSFPLILQSFGDYKPAIYAYLVIPFLTLFDLNAWVVRLPSAIFGILSVVAVYYLVLEVFKKNAIALLVSFFLAISPWHLQFSRVAFEANIGLSFNIFMTLFFIKSLKNPKFLFLAAFFAAVNIYTYQSEKVFTPLFLFALIILFRKQLFSLSKQYIISSTALLCIILFPMLLLSINNPEIFSRVKDTSILYHSSNFSVDDEHRLIFDAKNNDTIGKVIDSHRFATMQGVVLGYISHFDLNWLFIKGDINRHHAPFMGLLYIWELPFLLIGMYSLLFHNEFKKETKLLVFTWFLLAPVPASITNDIPHAVRTLNFLPTFQIFTAIGVSTAFVFLQKYFKQITYKYVIYGVFILIVLLNSVYYLDQYFVQQNYFYSQDWQYGYKEALSIVDQQQEKYNQIVVSNTVPLDQSYIFFLFDNQYPPQMYQESVSITPDNRRTLGKYIFRPIDWEVDRKKSRVLFVGSPKDFPQEIHTLKTIYFLDGSAAIKIVET